MDESIKKVLKQIASLFDDLTYEYDPSGPAVELHINHQKKPLARFSAETEGILCDELENVYKVAYRLYKYRC